MCKQQEKEAQRLILKAYRQTIAQKPLRGEIGLEGTKTDDS
jgi:hypothetical protein